MLSPILYTLTQYDCIINSICGQALPTQPGTGSQTASQPMSSAARPPPAPLRHTAAAAGASAAHRPPSGAGASASAAAAVPAYSIGRGGLARQDSSELGRYGYNPYCTVSNFLNSVTCIRSSRVLLGSVSYSRFGFRAWGAIPTSAGGRLVQRGHTCLSQLPGSICSPVIVI